MYQRIKKRKAILLPEGLKLIIAILCLLILFYLAFQLYNLFIKKTAVEQAKESLNDIANIINGLEDGKKIKYVYTAPKDWVIVFNGNEYCSCPKDALKGTVTREFFQCKEQGVCKESPYNFELNEVCFVTKNCLDFQNIPRELFLRKESNKIVIYTKEEEDIGKLLDRVLSCMPIEGEKDLQGKIIDYLELTAEERRNNINLRTELFKQLNSCFEQFSISEALGISGDIGRIFEMYNCDSSGNLSEDDPWISLIQVTTNYDSQRIVGSNNKILKRDNRYFKASITITNR
ncbi:MAG: hypothetical protein Q8N99_04145 [Nanoarchaeota archaeon]|nr:hypothetical protein [Nanoarchaeota archaeon]